VKRFWQKVQIEGPDECWLWTAAKYNNGYGVIHYEGRNQGAHRVSWQLHNRDIPSGMCVCHKCDNPACVNPNHLWLGTVKDNMRDKSRKGHAGGERHPSARLTEEDVKQIRDTYVPYSRTFGIYALGRKFGVCAGHIHSIIHRKSWSHI
jgi:hypothetical protein